MFAQVVVVILSADLLDDCAQHHIAGIAVLLAAARFEQQRLIFKGLDQLTDGADMPLAGIPCIVPVMPHPGLVAQQLADGHFVGDLLRILREIRCDGIIQIQFAFLLQLGNGGGGEFLVDRSDVKLGVDAVGHIVALAGQPEGFLIKRLPAFRNEYCPGETVGGGFRLEIGIQFRYIAEMCHLCCGSIHTKIDHLMRRIGTQLELNFQHLPALAAAHRHRHLKGGGFFDVEQFRCRQVRLDASEHAQMIFHRKMISQFRSEITVDKSFRRHGIPGINRIQ